MIKLVRTFEQWHNLHLVSQENLTLPEQEQLLQKMGELAKTFWEWLKVYKSTGSNPKFRALALKKMSEFVIMQ